MGGRVGLGRGRLAGEEQASVEWLGEARALRRLAGQGGGVGAAHPGPLGLELEKLERDVRVIVHHIKPPCIDRVREEVTALGDPRIEFLEQGRSYEF